MIAAAVQGGDLARFFALDDMPRGLFVMVFAGAGLLVHGGRCILALRYRPLEAPPEHRLPSLSVIVPAYNEGANVRRTILSVLASRYPTSRIEVIAVDDGSTDDTWTFIQAAARRDPDRVIVVRHPRNKGKREALATGMARARGEVVVTVDSDSTLEPDALRHLVAPLVADERVAVVSGNVFVMNRDCNLLTKLQSANFAIAYSYERAAQSVCGAVLCCPGVLSAYRRAAVAPIIERWSRQTFLGAPCSVGEDVALTTVLIGMGYRSVYQSTSIGHTIMPHRFSRMCRMLIRWKRGNLREAIQVLRNLARGQRPPRWGWALVESLRELFEWPAVMLATVLLLRCMGDVPQYLAVVGVTSLLISLNGLRAAVSLDFVYFVGYVVLHIIALPWLYPYSLFTIRDGRWLTR